MFRHVQYYTRPEQQLYIVRILFIVPLYAILSWLSIRYHHLGGYFDSIRDIYESFVVYCFLTLVLGYVGGESSLIVLLSHKNPLAHPWPFCFLPKMQLNVRFLRFCKQSCIQFIVLKPIMAFLTLILMATNHQDDVAYYWFELIVYNISYTLALYGLLLFYLAVRADIRAFSPVRKFFAVKIVIFATYWQALAVTIAPGMTYEEATRWNDFILCIEMNIFAFIHINSFPWWEFQTGIPEYNVINASLSVLSFKDVGRDVYHNIMPAYQTYVLQGSDGDHEPRVVRTRTYMLGNMADPKMYNRFFVSPNQSEQQQWQVLHEKTGAGSNGKNAASKLVSVPEGSEMEEKDGLDVSVARNTVQNKLPNSKKSNSLAEDEDMEINTPSDQKLSRAEEEDLVYEHDKHSEGSEEIEIGTVINKKDKVEDDDEDDTEDDETLGHQLSDEESDGLMQGKWSHVNEFTTNDDVNNTRADSSAKA
ncbi:hypothetical protein RFI_05233 [Reticulomyxa filosa]|uniref:Transmembrane protein n=1 Tax=Reticulomyxa filosa TaxID=46433 RepID=X6P2V4_RETFI|nr:hypothetical protein RFI_05233 [Reticulomyxa filosa]|eukprot:ETO31882.1 hypothetical protein RFI_05233 [Reticulomyxa filosa]